MMGGPRAKLTPNGPALVPGSNHDQHHRGRDLDTSSTRSARWIPTRCGEASDLQCDDYNHSPAISASSAYLDSAISANEGYPSEKSHLLGLQSTVETGATSQTRLTRLKRSPRGTYCSTAAMLGAKPLLFLVLVSLFYVTVSTYGLSSNPFSRSQTYLPPNLTLRQSQSSSNGSIAPTTGTCPDFSEYSKFPHEPRTNGSLRSPYQRPLPSCRTFNSSVVEKVVVDVRDKMKDVDLGRLWENAFPNTLDTTVKFRDDNLTFIITGDITAEWLRDTCNQFSPFHDLTTFDPSLQSLIRGVIQLQSRYISQHPYCGAFQAPRESGLSPVHNDWADGIEINPPVDNLTVFECKYELDSLASFLKLSRKYHAATNDASFTTFEDGLWSKALDQIFRVIEEQRQPTFDENGISRSYYNFTGLISPIINGGNGSPKAYTGLVATSHRPSDDPTLLPFNIPTNAMMSVELRHLADLLRQLKLRPDLESRARSLSREIERAVWEWGVVDHRKWGRIFAYEVDGYGSTVIMDDANVPSLLSLPYLGFLSTKDPTYLRTRSMLFSPRGQGYYSSSTSSPAFSGHGFYGIGGPHVGYDDPWPMSLITFILTADLEDESEVAKVEDALRALKEYTAGLGLIHESVDVKNSTQGYTRQWFAWANTYFGESMLHLAEKKPELIFRDGLGPYKAGGSHGTLDR